MQVDTIVGAVILGILEGLTEFIPVSSTAHLLLAGKALGFENPGKTFEVLIQLGAILAILTVYSGRLLRLAGALPTGEQRGVDAFLIGNLGTDGVKLAVHPAIVFRHELIIVADMHNCFVSA